MLPIHWATFVLGFHPWAEPAERALRAAAAHGVALALPAPGRRIDLAGARAAVPSTPWWASEADDDPGVDELREVTPSAVGAPTPAPHPRPSR